MARRSIAPLHPRGMEDVWLDALHHSISSSSWLDAARAWVDANCAAFEPDPSEYSCGQFQLFAEFRELADKLLQAAEKDRSAALS